MAGMCLRSTSAPGAAYDDPKFGQDPQPALMKNCVKLPNTEDGIWAGVSTTWHPEQGLAPGGRGHQRGGGGGGRRLFRRTGGSGGARDPDDRGRDQGR